MWQVEARRGKASRRCIEPPEHDVADPETSWHYYCKCTKTVWRRAGPCETVRRIATFRNRAEPCGTVQNRAKPCRTVRNRAEPGETSERNVRDHACTVRNHGAPCGTVQSCARTVQNHACTVPNRACTVRNGVELCRAMQKQLGRRQVGIATGKSVVKEVVVAEVVDVESARYNSNSWMSVFLFAPY